MKLNMTVRWKNPWTWIGIISLFLTVIGIAPESFTSWQSVADALYSFINNPFLIGSFIVALLSMFVDPTTAGFSDSTKALTYKQPSKE